MMKKLTYTLILLITLYCTAQKSSITIIDLETFTRETINTDVQLVDVRTPAEYHAGCIGNAILINSANENTFSTKFQELDKTKPVYLYCHSGWRSHRASKKLAAMGFCCIYDFKGGYSAWSAKNKE